MKIKLYAVISTIVLALPVFSISSIQGIKTDTTFDSNVIYKDTVITNSKYNAIKVTEWTDHIRKNPLSYKDSSKPTGVFINKLVCKGTINCCS